MPGCRSRRERHPGRPVERGRFRRLLRCRGMRQPRGLGLTAADRSKRHSGAQSRVHAAVSRLRLVLLNGPGPPVVERIAS
jgi:hypothetical protein